MTALRLFYTAALLLLAACSEELAKQPVNYPEADSAAAQMMLEKCSSCHAAPIPGMYAANVWPGVVYRMQLQMNTHGFEPITETQRVVIVDYLQRHAAQKENK